MIYLKTTNNKKILILEPGNIKSLENGDIVFSPDDEVKVMYTPDAAWLGEQIVKDNEWSLEKLDNLHQESLKRNKIEERPYHPIKKYSRAKEN